MGLALQSLNKLHQENSEISQFAVAFTLTLQVFNFLLQIVLVLRTLAHKCLISRSQTLNLLLKFPNFNLSPLVVVFVFDSELLFGGLFYFEKLLDLVFALL